ncbi:hypothetical protein BH09PSE5_BH09PSE5_28940 [soil metagenome]
MSTVSKSVSKTAKPNAKKAAANAASAKTPVAPKKTVSAQPAARPADKAADNAAKPVVKTAKPTAAVKSTAKPTGSTSPKSSAGASGSLALTASAVPKQKLVRDSFTMPRADFDLVDALKGRALAFHRPAKKSELLRAGLHALAALSGPELRASLEKLTPLKTGRPKKIG